MCQDLKLRNGNFKIIYIKNGANKIVYDPDLQNYFFQKTFQKHSRESEATKCLMSRSIYLIRSNYILCWVSFCFSFTVKLKVNSLKFTFFLKEPSYLTLPFSSFHFPTDVLVQPQIAFLSKIPRTSLERFTASLISLVTSIFSRGP